MAADIGRLMDVARKAAKSAIATQATEAKDRLGSLQEMKYSTASKRSLSTEARERLTMRMLVFGEKPTACAIGVNVHTCWRAAAGLYLNRTNANLLETVFGGPREDESTS